MKTLKRMMGLLVLVVLLVLLAGTEGNSRIIVAGCPPGYIYSIGQEACVSIDEEGKTHNGSTCLGGAYEYEDFDYEFEAFRICSNCTWVFGIHPRYIQC